MRNIPLSVPNLKSGNERKYVLEAIDAEWVSTGGQYINDFEKALANYLKTDKVVACQSGTAAIHVALMLAGVKMEDEVIVPTLTFIAAVNPVTYVKAHPVFMDVDETLCMDLNKLENFLTNQTEMCDGVCVNKKTGRSIKALVMVHVYGNMTDMAKLMEICNRHNIKVIEDATEALGSYITEGALKGKHAGTIGHFAALSFNGNKIITTGGGGAVVARKIEDLEKATYLTTQAKNDALYYLHDEVGYNYRMTNLQAALGLAQLEQLDEFISLKYNNFTYYKNKIDAIDGLEILPFSKTIKPNYWFYTLLVKENFSINRDELQKRLSEKGIQTRPVWGLIHKQKPYLQCETYEINKALEYYDQILNIPCSSNLTKDDIDYIVESIKEIAEL